MAQRNVERIWSGSGGSRCERARSGFGALSDWPAAASARSDLVVFRELRSVRHGEDCDAHEAAGLVDGALHLVRHGGSALVQNRKLGLEGKKAKDGQAAQIRSRAKADEGKLSSGAGPQHADADDMRSRRSRPRATEIKEDQG